MTADPGFNLHLRRRDWGDVDLIILCTDPTSPTGLSLVSNQSYKSADEALTALIEWSKRELVQVRQGRLTP